MRRVVPPIGLQGQREVAPPSRSRRRRTVPTHHQRATGVRESFSTRRRSGRTNDIGHRERALLVLPGIGRLTRMRRSSPPEFAGPWVWERRPMWGRGVRQGEEASAGCPPRGGRRAPELARHSLTGTHALSCSVGQHAGTEPQPNFHQVSTHCREHLAIFTVTGSHAG